MSHFASKIFQTMNQDFKEFFELLNAKGVSFLVVGGVAFNFHATPRATKDIDVWVHPTEDQLRRLLAAFTEFGFVHDLDPAVLLDAGNVIMLGRVPNRIDVLTQIAGVDWEICWKNRVQADYDSIPISFLSLDDLLAAKRAAGRPQDLADANKLEQVLESRRQ